MATLQDIADEVGVAISTVSRVLNGTPDARVTDEVRQRVLSTADALGYVPNLYARGLARGRGSHASVCVWSMMSHSSSLRNRAISRAAANVYAQTITTDVSPMSSPDELLQLLNSQLPQACILVSGSWRPDTMARVVQHLHGRGVHCVVVDSSWALDPSVPCDTVRADRTSGSKLAVSHLIEQGHRHIGIVSLLRITGRVAGYEEALDEQGITDRYIAPLDPDIPYLDDVALADCAEQSTRDLLKRHPCITGLFCGSDVLALAAMRGLDALGLRVPEDVAVVGFDNDTWSRYLPVPLTTIEHPLDELQEKTQELLEARLHEQGGPWRRERAKYRLIERASTAPTEGGVEEAAH